MDKLLHFITGFMIGMCPVNADTAYHFSIIAGIGKEVYDYKHPRQHSAEVADAIATVVGGTLAHELRTDKHKHKPNFKIIMPDGKEI